MNTKYDRSSFSKKGEKKPLGLKYRGRQSLAPLKKKDDDERGQSGSATTGIDTSFLIEETAAMERMQRLAEQAGHRKFGVKVHAREHNTEEQKQSPEGDLQNSIPQHPLLDGQRFDGIDPNLNPEPPLNTEARREFDNEKREQEMEKQLRLGNMPKFSTAPKPSPG